MNETINALRFLGLDMVDEANSGHPGIVLGAAPVLYQLFTKHMHATPEDAHWFNRDRFVMSAGHGSALVYALYHLAGYDLSIGDLKQFRQVGSTTPGHPEYGHTHGIEATTGPLGQGIGNAVGMAIAEAHLRARFNKGNLHVIDHYTYALCGDGDLQEGVAMEALALAGHLGLDRFVVLFDSNDIQLDGPTKQATSMNIKGFVKSLGFDYFKVDDANDLDALDRAIKQAKVSPKPAFVEIKSVIGFGAKAAGTAGVHGAPLGKEETARIKEAFDYPYGPFEAPKSAYDDFLQTFGDRSRKAYLAWQETMDIYAHEYPKDFAHLEDIMTRNVALRFDQLIPPVELGTSEATRNTIGKLLDTLSDALPSMIGGSADLSVSTKVKGNDGFFTKETPTGRNIQYGVREHAMAAITNGLALHHMKAFAGGFFIFSDYMKPSIRLAALMQLPSIFIFTHDSVAVGEDGPTHEPIEQLATFRSTPGLVTLRPADANETRHALRFALEARKTPTVMALTRQNVPVVTEVDYDTFKQGAYVIKKHKDAEGILIATGSEVALAMAVSEHLETEHQRLVNVVSMPSMERFLSQPQKVQDSVLPPSLKKRLAVELGSTGLWYRFSNHVYGIDTFGASGKGDEVLKHFGFTKEALTKAYLNLKDE